MSAWTDKATFCRFLDQAVNNGVLDVIDEVFHHDFTGYITGAADPVRGTPGCRQWVQELRTAFPDLNALVEGNWLIAETSAHEAGKGRSADRVAALLVLRGTHHGTYLGIAPTGKRVEWPLSALLTFSGGKISQAVVISDDRGLHSQLNAGQATIQESSVLRLPELI